jgi:uncharacterized RmlC-like cupin family protein
MGTGHCGGRDNGVRVIKGNQLNPKAPQTPGMNRAAAINGPGCAQKSGPALLASILTPRPARHHHGALECVIYVVRGKARMRWGEHVEFVADGRSQPQPHLPALRHAIIARIIGSHLGYPITEDGSTEHRICWRIVGSNCPKSRMCDALRSYAARARSAALGHNTTRAHNQQSK